MEQKLAVLLKNSDFIQKQVKKSCSETGWNDKIMVDHASCKKRKGNPENF